MFDIDVEDQQIPMVFWDYGTGMAGSEISYITTPSLQLRSKVYLLGWTTGIKVLNVTLKMGRSWKIIVTYKIITKSSK